MDFNANDVADVVSGLVDSKVSAATTRVYRRGIVAAVSGQLADVYIEGNNVPTKGILTLGTYAPQVNDKVLILSIGDSGINRVILGPINPTVMTWITPTLAGSWAQFDQGGPGYFGYMQYARDNQGFVHLRGLALNASNGAATSGALIYTLPAGYRPYDTVLSAVVANDTFARLDIGTDGGVRIAGATSVPKNGWISSNNIVFQVYS